MARFTAPVTCLDVNPSHTHLAAGSAEFTIKVVEISDSSKTSTLHSHEAPLLCVKFDPRGELLVGLSQVDVCGLDGTFETMQ